MHPILGLFSAVAHINLSHFWDALTGMYRNAFNFYAVAHLSEGLNFCSRSQFISKGLVSKMSQNKWFMEYFWLNFGFNFLESLTFLARNILHSHTPAQLLWLRTWSGQKYFRSRSPFGSLRVRSFHTRSGACSPPFFFFFFSTPTGLPMGPVGPHWLYKPFGLVHRTPLGSGIKIPFADFYNVT